MQQNTEKRVSFATENKVDVSKPQRNTNVSFGIKVTPDKDVCPQVLNDFAALSDDYEKPVYSNSQVLNDLAALNDDYEEPVYSNSQVLNDLAALSNDYEEPVYSNLECLSAIKKRVEAFKTVGTPPAAGEFSQQLNNISKNFGGPDEDCNYGNITALRVKPAATESDRISDYCNSTSVGPTVSNLGVAKEKVIYLCWIY